MIRAFIDASVFVSASLSSPGASREILLMALRGQVALVISDIVLLETERHLSALPKGAPEALAIFRQLTAALDVEVVAADEAAVRDAATYTHPKDAPIVAAARVAAVII